MTNWPDHLANNWGTVDEREEPAGKDGDGREALYGGQTRRALANFDFRGPRLHDHPDLVRALALVKIASARANRRLGSLAPEVADAVIAAAREVQQGLHDGQLKGSLRSGSGLIHTLGADYSPLYEGKLAVVEVERRIAAYYLPYHSALAELLERRRDAFGRAFQLSCHSMSSVGPRDGLRRPQICLGDLNGTTASPGYAETVAQVFRDAGFEVALNTPFPGNELLRRNASPGTGIESLQVELRRDLYLDERTRRLHGGLPALQGCFVALADAVRNMG